MNLLTYRERDFYMGDFDESTYQLLIRVDNWKPRTVLVDPGDYNEVLYLNRLIQDGFVFMDSVPETIIPGDAKLTAKGKERLEYLKERLGR